MHLKASDFFSGAQLSKSSFMQMLNCYRTDTSSCLNCYNIFKLQARTTIDFATTGYKMIPFISQSASRPFAHVQDQKRQTLQVTKGYKYVCILCNLSLKIHKKN